MPELPDINAYLCALDARIVGRTLGWTMRRASLHIVAGETALRAMDPGGRTERSSARSPTRA